VYKKRHKVEQNLFKNDWKMFGDNLNHNIFIIVFKKQVESFKSMNIFASICRKECLNLYDLFKILTN